LYGEDRPTVSQDDGSGEALKQTQRRRERETEGATDVTQYCDGVDDE